MPIDRESIQTNAASLVEQARKLREEADTMKREIEEDRQRKLAKETDNIDAWIQFLLVNLTIDEDTQMLNTVDQVVEQLQQGRFSQEQVMKMYNRICETGPPQSRSKCSPIMALLVDAAGKLDSMDRKKNPNKRWSGKVERKLRRKLFAADWGLTVDDEDEEDLGKWPT